MRDARDFQIATLTALLVYGLVRLDFEIVPAHAAVVVIAAQATQLVASRLVGLPRFDPRSALISSLSLTLLLRTDSVVLAAAAAVVTIATKFAVRWDGRHVLNPTNAGLVVMMLLTDGVWVSPGQWGSPALAAFLTACVGSVVVRRASRSDVTWAFLAFWVALLCGRAWWLGDPWAIPLHQLSNGAFLLFAFFMISDPKTTPDSRAGRVLFAGLVAAVAFWIGFVLYRPSGLIWALALCCPLVPVLNRLLPGARFTWRGSAGTPLIDSEKGDRHEPSPRPLRPVAGRAARPAGGPRLLRLLRRQGRYEAVQPGLPGRAGPQR